MFIQRLKQLLKSFLSLNQISDQPGNMAEAEEEAKQFCAEVTENKAESHATLNQKEDEQPDTKRNGKIIDLKGQKPILYH